MKLRLPLLLKACILATYSISMCHTADATTLTWKGQSATWSVGGEANWKEGTNDKAFADGDAVIFDGGVGNATQDITVSGTVAPTTMEFIGAAKAYSFIGGGTIRTTAIYISGPSAGNTLGTTINIKGGTTLETGKYKGASFVNTASATRATNYVNIGGDSAGILKVTGNGADDFVLSVTGWGNGGDNKSVMSILTNGQVISENAVMKLQLDGSVALKIDGGTATLKGLHMGVQGNKDTDLYLSNSGTLNLGASGLIKPGGTRGVIHLGQGTVGAWENWTVTECNIKLGYSNVDNTTTATTFNTGMGVDTNGYTITVDNVLVDYTATKLGKVVKDGAGNLILKKVNTYSGGTELQGGTLTATDMNALGKAGTRQLMVTGDATLAFESAQTYSFDKLSIAGGKTVSFLNLSGAVLVDGSKGLGLSSAGTGTIASNIAIDGGTVSFNGVGGIKSTGTITFSAAPTLLTFTNTAIGKYTLFSGTSITLGVTGADVAEKMGNQFSLLGVSTRYITWEVTNNSIVMDLKDTSTTGASLTWKGQSGIWGNKATTKWNTSGGGEDIFWNGDKAIFNGDLAGSAATQDITVSGTVAAATIEFIGAAKVYNFIAGGTIMADALYISGPLRGNTVGTTLNIKDGVTLSTKRYRGADVESGTATKATNYVNIGGASSGKLEVTGSGADDFVLSVTGHGNGDDYKSVLTILTNGELVALNTALKMQKDGSSALKIDGGSAKLKGIHMGDGGDKNTDVYLTNNGVLSLGSSGIVKGSNQANIHLGLGTLAAYETWTSAVDMKLGYVASGTGTISTTVDTSTFTVNLTGILSDSSETQLGGLIKNGTGVLELRGANIYSGGTVINAGEIVTYNETALGSGKVTVNGGAFRSGSGALIINGLELKSKLNISSTITVNGSIVGNGQDIDINVDKAGNITLNGISTDMGVIKVGRNTVTIGADANITAKAYYAGVDWQQKNTLNIEGSLTTEKFMGAYDTGHQNVPTITIKNGGKLIVTGDKSSRDANASMALGWRGWGYGTPTAHLIMEEGSYLSVKNATLFLGLEASGKWTMLGGKAEIKGLDINAGAGPDYKGDFIFTGGEVHIGSGGLTNGSGTAISTCSIVLGDVILGSWESWESNARATMNLKGQTGTTFQTNAGTTMTLNGVLQDNVEGDVTTVGNIIKTGEGTLVLNAVNTFTGKITFIGGGLKMGVAGAFGSNKEFTVNKGMSLDLNNLALSGGKVLLQGGLLKNMGGYGSSLFVMGTPDKSASKAEGGLNVNGLNMGSLENGVYDANARLQVSGDMTANGGNFYLDMTNVNTDLVTVSGNVNLGGAFTIYFDTNTNREEDSWTYKLFKGNVSGSSSATLKVEDSQKDFFEIDASNFTKNGSVIVQRATMSNELVTNADFATGGVWADGFIANNRTTYLGALSGNVYIDKEYVDFDGTYRMTNGKGWMTYAGVLSGDKNLLIREYILSDAIQNSGVILSNNANTFTGGTKIENVHVIIDGALNQSAPIDSGVVHILGTGAVSVFGNKGHLELRTGGAGDNRSFTYNNAIVLNDGAKMSQVSGQNTMIGTITINNSGILANTTANEFKFTNKISGALLTLQGTSFLVSGATATMELNSLTLESSVVLNLSDASQSKLANINLGANAKLNVSGGAVLNMTTSSGTGSINLNQGTVKVYKNSTFNSAGTTTMNFSKTGINVLDNNGYNLTMGSLGADQGSFTSLGWGDLRLSGDYSQYTGTITQGGGIMKIDNDVTYNGGIIISQGANMFIGNNDKFSASSVITLDNNSKATIGNDNSFKGKLILNQRAILNVGENNNFGGQVIIGEVAKVNFGKNTQFTCSAMSIDRSADVSFEQGTVVSGEMAQAVQVKGAINGFLVLENGNGIHFDIGGRLNIRESDLAAQRVESLSRNVAPKASIQASGDIVLSVTSLASKKFSLDRSINDNLTLTDSFCLLTSEKADGIKVKDEGGQEIALTSDNWDLRNYKTSSGQIIDMLDMGGKKFAWFVFDIRGASSTGGNTADTVNMNIIRNVRYDWLALNDNEYSVATTLTKVGQYSGAKLFSGELQQLGNALALASAEDAGTILTSLTNSAASVLNGYTAQITNLRQHSLSVRNRALLETPSVQAKYGSEQGSSVWASGEGGAYRISNNNNAPGFSSTMWGGSLGVTSALSTHVVGGLSFTYTSSDVNTSAGYGDATNDAYYIDGFARYSKNNWNVTGVITAGTTDMETTRHSNVGIADFYNYTTKGSTSGNQVMGLVEVGYEIQIDNNKNEIIEPFALVSVGYSSLDAYTESGAGNAGYNIDSQSTTLASLGAGLRYINQYMTESSTVNPGRVELRAMVLQDLSDPQVTVEGRYIGLQDTNFSVDAASPGKSALIIGAGVVQPVAQEVSFFADVNGEFRSGANGVNANIGVKVTF